MTILNVLSGNLLLFTYAANIFEESGSKIDPYISAIILSTIQVFGNYLAYVLIDRLGRRTLLIISATGTAVGMFGMGLFNYFINQGWNLVAFDWIPVVSLSFAVLTTSVGISTLLFVVLAEVLPLKVLQFLFKQK